MDPLSFDKIPEIKRLITDAILGNKHNVIVVWGELGLGKTTLMLKLLLWIVLRYIYGFKDKPDESVDAFHARVCNQPNSLCEHWQHVLKLVDFTFWETKKRIKDAVLGNVRLPAVGWDDLAVYFHRSNIQYMHPEVKDFFSKYNFVRPYLANMFITVPDINFVPEQLLAFCTADIWINTRGVGDFDRAKLRRSFWGVKRSWTKHYDGYDVSWKKCPEPVYAEYERIRHEHALKAFKFPEEIFVTRMPRAKAFTEEESLF